MRVRNRHGRRMHKLRGHTGSLTLTSMMDILTVLLLFLLKSYSAGGEVMVPQPGVHLPESTADASPETSLIVAIDGDAIRVGSQRVASVSEVMASPDPGIAPLAARLQAEPHDAAHAAPVTIQGDRTIEYALLRKVMFTLSRSGYDNVALAVLRKA